MKARILAALAALALALGLTAITAPAAQAGTLCNLTGICGQVVNSGSSTHYLWVTGVWPPKSQKALGPGQASYNNGIKDADGFYVGAGCTATDQSGGRWGSGTWHKIPDGQWLQITYRC